METAATGRSTLVGLDLNDAVDETVLNVTTTATTIAPAVFVDASAATGGGVSVLCSPNATSYDTTVGGGVAGNGIGYSVLLSAAGATAAGVFVSSTGANNGDGVRVNMGAGSGYGVFSTSASSSAAGSFVSTGVGLALNADATGGTSGSCATFSGGTSRVIRATASAAAIAGEFIGGSTAGTGAVTARTTNNTGAVIAASVPNTATSAARGFYCSTGTSGAMAAEFVSSGSGASGNFALQVSGDTVVPVTVPAIGTRSYRLSITTSSATEIRVRDVTMDFIGTVD